MHTPIQWSSFYPGMTDELKYTHRHTGLRQVYSQRHMSRLRRWSLPESHQWCRPYSGAGTLANTSQQFHMLHLFTHTVRRLNPSYGSYWNVRRSMIRFVCLFAYVCAWICLRTCVSACVRAYLDR